MTQNEKDGIEMAINPLTIDDAIRLVNAWTLSRILDWDDDLIVFLLHTLISRIGMFDVDIPDIWYNIVLNPNILSSLKEDNNAEHEYTGSPLGDWRPTSDAEMLFNSEYI